MALPKEQNFQVSATGGAGTNGQPARYAAGVDNAGEFYDIQTQARMAGKNPAVSRVPSPSGQRPFRGDSANPLVPLNSPTTRQDEDVRMGATMGMESMYATDNMANAEDMERMRQALPYLSVLAELPEVSNAYRNYVRYLRGIL
jgi:hypothetical protein